jgi:hypothetical protein
MTPWLDETELYATSLLQQEQLLVLVLVLVLVQIHSSSISPRSTKRLSSTPCELLRILRNQPSSQCKADYWRAPTIIFRFLELDFIVDATACHD